jgi:two-component system, NarL family, nitrate/nitrite response regulator NarL
MAQSLRLMQMGERMVPMDFIMLLMRQAGIAGNISNAAVPDDDVSSAIASNTSSAGISADAVEKSPSNREAEILKYLVSGFSNKMIARHLGITEATVKVHLKGILRKIRVSNRTQAAVWALNNGIEVPSLPLPNTGAAGSALDGLLRVNELQGQN